MADKTDEGTKPAKKKGKLKLLLGALVLIGAGAGGAYAAGQMGYIGGTEEHGPDEPKLLRKGDSDPYAPSGEGAKATEFVEGEGGSEYRTSYFSFEESFTSNLKESAGLIQVNLAASTRRDGRVLQWLAKHELALRSEMLVQLAETTEMEATSAAGKEKLKKRLTAAINEVLTETEGFGGVDDVYFRGYLVQ